MLTFVVFLISLVLIVFLFTMKIIETSYNRKTFLVDFFVKADVFVSKILFKIKFWWSHLNFKNTKLIFSWIIVSMRKLIIAVKRRFDHKQSHFFIKKEHDVPKNKGSVSFFLKHVSDYKKSLRENNDNKIS